MTGSLRWVLAGVGLASGALLVAGVLLLFGDVAAADQRSLPPTPRTAPLVLVRERGGYTPTPVSRATPLPTPTAGPREVGLPQAPPAAANAAPAKPPATGAAAPRSGAAAGPPPAATTTRREDADARLLATTAVPPRSPAATATPTRAGVTADAAAPHTPTMTPAVLPPRRTATSTPTVAAATAVPSPTAVPPTPAPSATSAPPTAAPTPPPTLAPKPAPIAATGYQLGDVVPITEVLKGFAFTAHWLSSAEGVYATDWYPRSTTDRCADSHRLPLAMPVAGKWRLVSQQGTMGGALYTLIGDLDDGNSVAFTHVDRDVLTGRVAAYTVVGFVGISGLEQFNAAGLNPSHAHTAWNDRLVPGWNGDQGNRPARDFFAQYGFRVELRDPALEASPQTYMAGRSCGGMP